MWQEALKPHVEVGELVVIGVVQEQHPDRAALYRQWRRLDWPIFVDSLNLLDLDVVPVPIGIDASGVVRGLRLSPRNVVKSFIDADFPPSVIERNYNRAAEPDPAEAAKQAEKLDTAGSWRDLGDAWFHSSDGLERAIEAYRRAVLLDPGDGRAQFRLGVALRRRYESRSRRGGDAQAAVQHWGLALASNPNQYIWRRRIQQYGPRLDKPYNFYNWIEGARSEILARGETPVALSVEPSGSEILAPGRGSEPRGGEHGQAGATRTSAQTGKCGIVGDRVRRDTKRFVGIEAMVTPARVRPGQRVRVRLMFRLNERTRPFWNNEAEGLRICVDLPDQLTLGEGGLMSPNPEPAETQEVRAIEFELAVGDTAPAGSLEIPTHALYYVCENKGGKCRYLRQDLEWALNVDPVAPKIR